MIEFPHLPQLTGYQTKRVKNLAINNRPKPAGPAHARTIGAARKTFGSTLKTTASHNLALLPQHSLQRSCVDLPICCPMQPQG